MAVSGTIFQGSTCTPTSRVHVDKKGASKSLKQEMFKQGMWKNIFMLKAVRQSCHLKC